MKDQHFCLRIPFCDRFRFCENLLIRAICVALGIMIEVTTITVDDAYNGVARWRRTIFPERSFTMNRGDGTARKQKRRERDAEYSSQQHQVRRRGSAQRSVMRTLHAESREGPLLEQPTR